ncbi:MFS transporter [Pseudooceanicola nanhaiensis]|uniref:MFS transporter n=1 Tax=Pseudooceanicola nanhaiensis TaxID=375761 RepID=UPI001CD29A30|nr:MFS transporter [Pseudooceanicola nanhaiensis]MCA0921439.1 MFS transporter [Pseudooceanicola nanhaiensis]
MKLNPALAALSLGSFAIGLTEFSPMGLLPTIAGDLAVSIPDAGLIVTAYAFGVMIFAPVVTLAGARMARNRLLILLALVLAAGNLLSAAAPSFAVLLVARVLSALCQGTFFGVGAIVAAGLVALGRQAGAVAAVFMGLTVANVIGVPAMTWLGEATAWRLPFVVIAALGVLTALALSRALPSIPAPEGADVRKEIGVMLSRPVLFALGMTVLTSTGQFTVFTYVAPILQDATGASGGLVTLALVVIGLGMSVGNVLGGRAADRSLRATLIGTLVGLIVLLAILPLALPHVVPTLALLFIWGGLCFALVPTMQMRVMGAAGDAPSLASSVNIGAFNLGNGLGALVGGMVIRLGLGYPDIALASAVVFAIPLGIVLLQGRGRAQATV